MAATSFIVSYDDTNGKDETIMLVGTKKGVGDELKIVNAFRGDAAINLYKRLTNTKGKPKDELGFTK